MKHGIRVSVCIATYNGEAFVRDQLMSIIRQLTPHDELIVVDDRSTDATVRTVLGALQQTNLSYSLSVNLANVGPLRSFERALSQASGEFVFLADQDDIWMPTKLNDVLRELETYDLVMTDARVVDQSLQTIHPSFYALRRSGPGLWRNFLKSRYVGCCMAFRRSVACAALPIPRGVYMHDVWIGMIAEANFTVSFLSGPQLLYRRHDRNVTSTSHMRKMPTLSIIRKRAILAFWLCIRTIRWRFARSTN